jgi:hypothetical protein
MQNHFRDKSPAVVIAILTILALQTNTSARLYDVKGRMLGLERVRPGGVILIDRACRAKNWSSSG